jgi:beta-aspartyl-peptidase (threonine type)
MPLPTPLSQSTRRILLIILILSVIPMFATAQSTDDPHAKDRSAISQLLITQQDDWNKGNVDAFMSAYWKSPDLTFSGASGTQRGYDAVYARYKRSYPDRASMGHLDFSELEFHFTGNDGALVLGHWHLTREKSGGGDIGGVFSLVWQRFPEGWRIIHDHTSAVTPSK